MLGLALEKMAHYFGHLEIPHFPGKREAPHPFRLVSLTIPCHPPLQEPKLTSLTAMAQASFQSHVVVVHGTHNLFLPLHVSIGVLSQILKSSWIDLSDAANLLIRLKGTTNFRTPAIIVVLLEIVVACYEMPQL